ncbi:MAG: hypothetical protein H7315_06380 [Herminiimonas sp.]|nr:hypothetical protein [Herminiimonas sp.]
MFDQKKRRLGQLIFAVTIGVHIAAIYLSLTIKGLPVSSPSRFDPLTVMLIQAPENQAVTHKSAVIKSAPVPESKITNKTTTTTSAAPSKSAIQSSKNGFSPSAMRAPSQVVVQSRENPVAPPATPGQETPENLPSVPSGADSMILNALRNIGKIDRELRHAHPKLPDAIPDTQQSRLEKGIGAAAKAGSIKIETITFSDGRKMTKVTGPNGSYCAMVDTSNRNENLASGVRAQVTTCPN